MLNGIADRVDAIEPALKSAGRHADSRLCRIIDLLDDIKAATENLYPGVEQYEYPRYLITAAGGAKTVVEGREGYTKIVKTIALVGAAAADVDIFMGPVADASNFIRRVSLAAAGRTSVDVSIPVPEGQPLTVQASADTQVNMIVQRVSL